MKALLSRKVYPPAPNPKNDQRIHRVYKPTLYDFRLFPSCLTNLALLLVFFTFGLQGLYFLIPIMMCVTACFFVIQRKNQGPSTVVLSSQAVLCLIFVFLQIITLFATGSIRDEKHSHPARASQRPSKEPLFLPNLLLPVSPWQKFNLVPYSAKALSSL